MITGATAGIGKAIAIKLAENNFDIIITGRRANKLDNLEKELRSKYKIRALALSFDIQNRDECFKAIEKLPKDWANINILINNAGLAAGLESIQNGHFEKLG